MKSIRTVLVAALALVALAAFAAPASASGKYDPNDAPLTESGLPDAPSGLRIVCKPPRCFALWNKAETKAMSSMSREALKALVDRLPFPFNMVAGPLTDELFDAVDRAVKRGRCVGTVVRVFWPFAAHAIGHHGRFCR